LLTILVTVTYGSRWNYLLQSLQSAFREGVDFAVVVNNASHDAISNLSALEFGKKVSVISLLSNTGSANGYNVGMKMAVAKGAQYILLLDDDNVLELGTLRVMRTAYSKAVRVTQSDNLIILGFRPDHQADISEKLLYNRVKTNPNSFFGFSVMDIPYKLFRRTFLFMHCSKKKVIPDQVKLDIGAYSGMYFHGSLLKKHGYPDPRIVLYGDDTEFSYRITRAGGAIYLVVTAQLRDLEKSWNAHHLYSSSFKGWLFEEGDSRAYYSARNEAYFEQCIRPHNTLVRNLNKIFYMTVMKCYALISGKMNRYRLITNAISDGEAKRLGMNIDHCL